MSSWVSVSGHEDSKNVTVAKVVSDEAMACPNTEDSGHEYQEIHTSGNSHNIMGNVYHIHQAHSVTNSEVDNELQRASRLILEASNNTLIHDDGLRKLCFHLCKSDLALSIAGAYIMESKSCCTDYLHLHENEVTLNVRASQKTLSEAEHKHIILSATLKITMHRLRSHYERAAATFSLLACFHPQYICYDLLSASQINIPDHIRPTVTNKVHFEHSMSVLSQYRLLRYTDGQYCIYAPIQTWNLDEALQSKDGLSYYKHATGCLARARDQSVVHRAAWHKSIVFHAEYLSSPNFRYLWKQASPDKEFLSAAHKICCAFEDSGRYRQAEMLCSQVLAAQTVCEGIDGTTRAVTTRTLGNVHLRLGEFDPAEKMLSETLATWRSVYGNSHPNSVIAATELASCFQKQKRLVAALKLLEEAQVSLQLMPQTAKRARVASWILHRELGIVYRLLERHEEALTTLETALGLAEELYGPSSRRTCRSIHHLARACSASGKLSLAQSLLERCLAGYLEQYGKDSSFTLDAISELCTLYERCGDLEKRDRLRADFGLLGHRGSSHGAFSAE